MRKGVVARVFRSIVVALAAWIAVPGLAGEFKVLVVMSYEEQNPWVKEIRAGIDSVLAASSEVTYFFMETKVNREAGPKKAEEALALYRTLQPNGVIAADDDAQAMFVAPFLKERTDTPVVFNGVNSAPSKYGYPAANVSGVLERAHARETLAFAKQLLPKIQSACFMVNANPSGDALRLQVDEEKSSYPAKINGFFMVENVDELARLEKRLRAECDALLVDSLEGVLDRERKPMGNLKTIQALKEIYKGPILGANRYQVEQGALAAVVKTGQEQGYLSAKMLLQAMKGTSIATLPIVRNVRGQRIINVTELDALKLEVRPVLLRGATLVKTVE